MGLRRGFISSIVLLGASFGWTATIPHLDVKRMDGTGFALPGDLRAKVNVLVIGFTRKAGTSNKAWIDRFEQGFRDEPAVAVFGVAVLASVPPLFRRLALDGVKKSVPDTKRGDFLVTFSDEEKWKELVGYEPPDNPYILVLDGRGNELARYHGLFGETAYSKIEKEIVRALAVG